jgi:hypothetical protein
MYTLKIKFTVWSTIACIPFRYKMQGVRDMLDIVKNFTWTDTPNSGGRTITGLISRAQRLAFRIQIGFVMNHTVYLVLRIVNKTKNSLFFNTWIPFDSESWVVYILMLIVQVDWVII